MTPEQRQELAARYDFAEGEREAIAAELAERQKRIALENGLAWCEQRAKEKHAAERAAAAEPPKRDWKDRSVMATKTDQWTAFIDQRIRIARKASQKSLLGAVGDVLGEEIGRLRKENETLRAALADVTARLDKLENENIERGSASLSRLRTVVSGN